MRFFDAADRVLRLLLSSASGNGEAARIRGNRVRDLNKIQSEAYRQVEEIRGVADATATEIYSLVVPTEHFDRPLRRRHFVRTRRMSDVFEWTKSYGLEGPTDPSAASVRTEKRTPIRRVDPLDGTLLDGDRAPTQ